MRRYVNVVRVIGVFLVQIIPLISGAAENIERRVSLSSLLGTVTVGGTQWQRLDLQPHFRAGAFEAVLDLELFLDDEGRFRDKGWDFSSRRKGLESLFRKVHYIRYGDPGDRTRRVYWRLGALEAVTLGQGMIMRRYRNTQDAPGVKRTGLDIQVRGARMAFRGVVNDLLDLDNGGPVVGGRMTFWPRGRWMVGGTVVLDTDQLSTVPDSIRTGLSRDAYGIAGVDVVYELLQGSAVQANLYGGVSRTLAGTDGGTGVSGPGIQVGVGALTFRGEYRWVSGRIKPGHFGALYELNRAVIDPSTGAVVTQEAAVEDLSMHGILGDMGLSLGGMIQAEASYQYLKGDSADEQILEGQATLMPGFLQHFQQLTLAEVYYEKRYRTSSPLDFLDGSPDTRFGYRLGVAPAEHLSIVWEVEFTYEPDDAGGFRRRRTLNLQSNVRW